MEFFFYIVFVDILMFIVLSVGWSYRHSFQYDLILPSMGRVLYLLCNAIRKREKKKFSEMENGHRFS